MNRRFLICILLFGLFSGTYALVCTWDLNKDIPYKDPVFYERVGQNEVQLVVPTERGIKITDTEIIYAICPGNRNKLSQFGQQEAEIVCAAGNAVKVGILRKPIKALECYRSAVADIFKTGIQCAGTKGLRVDIGFNSPAGKLYLFHVCYDYGRGIPLYSHHKIYGPAIKGTCTKNDRPAFRTDALPPTIPFNSAFTRKSQIAQFTKLVGKNRASSYLTSANYLARGHLAADADFLFHSWQRSTYFYANVIPQWQSINAGNWKRLEWAIRKLATNTNDILDVWTGASGTLELMDEHNKKVQLYLAGNDKIPIPKYIWKIVCTAAKHCISLMIFNNPYERSNEIVCKNICKETNWYVDSFDVPSKGVVICCDVNELNISLDASFSVSGVLKF